MVFDVSVMFELNSRPRMPFGTCSTIEALGSSQSSQHFFIVQCTFRIVSTAPLAKHSEGIPYKPPGGEVGMCPRAGRMRSNKLMMGWDSRTQTGARTSGVEEISPRMAVRGFRVEL
jgi:hypothetical protein